MMQTLMETECQAYRGGQDVTALDESFEVRGGFLYFDQSMMKGAESDSGGS